MSESGGKPVSELRDEASTAALTSRSKIRTWLPLTFLTAIGIATATGGAFLVVPPPVVPTEASPNRFSAERAEEFLNLVAGDGIPHPAGSDQNRVVQSRLIDAFETMGYKVEVQRTSHPLLYRREDADPTSVPLANIMVRIRGRQTGDAVMLVAHHDSVPYGPGAGDDGAGVAALMEIARMLRIRTDVPKRDIVFLVTDGEEYGMLGARKFVEEHAWAADIRWVVNLEARGTSGPSCMFETGSGNAGLIRTFGQVVRRPVSSSLFYEVYRSMPNDTDFTIFKRAGMNGFNFAFIGNVQHYHTPDDNLEQLSRDSLQHHGDNALALVTALADASDSPPVTGDAVWFDLFGRVLLWWPVAMGWIPIGLAIAGGFWHVARLAGDRPVTFKTIAIALSLPPICFLTIAASTAGFEWLLRTQGIVDSPWPEHGHRYVIAIWSLGIAVTAAISLWPGFVQHAIRAAHGAFGGLWFWWIAISVAAMLWLPGGSYLWLVPLTALLLGFLSGRALKLTSASCSSLAFATTTLIVWLPVEPLFYDAIGFRIPTVVGIRSAFVLTTTAPILLMSSTRSRWMLIMLALAISLLLTLV